MRASRFYLHAATLKALVSSRWLSLVRSFACPRFARLQGGACRRDTPTLRVATRPRGFRKQAGKSSSLATRRVAGRRARSVPPNKEGRQIFQLPLRVGFWQTRPSVSSAGQVGRRRAGALSVPAHKVASQVKQSRSAGHVFSCSLRNSAQSADFSLRVARSFARPAFSAN